MGARNTTSETVEIVVSALVLPFALGCFVVAYSVFVVCRKLVEILEAMIWLMRNL